MTHTAAKKASHLRKVVPNPTRGGEVRGERQRGRRRHFTHTTVGARSIGSDGTSPLELVIQRPLDQRDKKRWATMVHASGDASHGIRDEVQHTG